MRRGGALVFVLLWACDSQPGAPTVGAMAARGRFGRVESRSRPLSCKACLDIERCDPTTGGCVPDCGDNAVYVPATGPAGFTMGRNFMSNPAPTQIDVGKGHRTNSDVPHRVVLTKPFCMDAYEVTVREWKSCIAAGECPEPERAHRFVTWPSQDDHPVNAVDWRAAKHYCEVQGKSLPTEAQWEWAATGNDRRLWPWGNEFPTCEHADFIRGPLDNPAPDQGCDGGGPSAVGSRPKGAKEWPNGKIHDLAGNVWEWCLDNYRPYTTTDKVDPCHVLHEGSPHVVRGGGWNRSHQGIKTAFRGASRVTYRVPGLGFRCVQNPQ